MTRPLSSSMLAWLRAFEATARHRSFTQAAAELCITQGAVSQQVRRLEAALGLGLIHRQHPALALTAEGTRLASTLELALGSIREVLSDLRPRAESTPVTLSCSPSFALTWLTPRLNQLRHDQPRIDLRLYGEFHRLDRAQMIREHLEMAVRYDIGGYLDVDASPFLDEFLLPVASPAFVAAHPALRRPADLDPAELLHDARPWAAAADGEEWRHWFDAVGVAGKDLSGGKRFNLLQMAIAAALAGEGVAMGRLALVLDELEAGRLVDLFGLAVASPASYHFLSAIGATPRAAAIGEWLGAQGRRFATRRATFLAGLTHV